MNYPEIIESAVTNKDIVEYTLAEYGEKLGVYRNGDVAVGHYVGYEMEVDDRPIAVIACPGWSNVDQSIYTEPWVYESESDTYIDEEGTHHTIEECVESAIENDGSFLEEIVAKLIEVLV